MSMKKVICLVLAFIIMASSLCACSNSGKATDEMFALDTIITFSIYDNDRTLAKETIDKCKKEITRLEKLFSATLEGSDVYNINHSNSEKVSVGHETAELLRKSIKLSDSSGGTFDISIYPVVKLWGFDTKNYKVPTDSEISDVLKYVDFESIEVSGDNTVSIKDGMSIDLGAVAKGYIGERLYEMMKSQNIDSGLVNLGGMVITYSSDDIEDKWNIGVEYPDSTEIFATFKTNEKFTVTSGAYQRYFEENGKRYHHIIDPESGKPSVSDISSVTIITNDGVTGDALSTAFFVMGVEKTLEYIKAHEQELSDDFGVIILNSNKDKVYVSSTLMKNGFKLEGNFEDKVKIVEI